jgi:eukaryotic-like serine/threonine-protein kinase
MLEPFGRYQLLKKLATGGMGQVFLARQQGPVGFEKLVVVKRILPHLAEEEEFIQMFFDEARIAAHLNHPNIAQIYDLGEAEGTYYIAMEYLHGESVRAVNARANVDRGGMPLALKCRIIADAAAGLDFAHRAKSPSGQPLGLIHRDVSPQNVLVGFNGSVKLIDFGVAKARGKVSHTLTGAIKGKYAYMSPEQARGEPLDSRSDVFGLGTVFYELLTSSRLFKRESEAATLKAVVNAKVDPPSMVAKGIPKALDQIVLKALSRKTKERYQTAGDFLLDVEDFLIRQRLPSTNAHLAAFMHDLYSDFLAAEKAATEPSQVTLAPLSSNKSTSRSLSNSNPNQGVAKPLPGGDKSVSPSRHAPTSPSAPSRTGSKSGSNSNKAVVIADLESRLAATREEDTTQGVFFNTLFQSVAEKAGPAAEPQVRASVGAKNREYRDQSTYETTDFLKALWRAAEQLAPHVRGANVAFYELGGASMQRLLQIPENAPLQRAIQRKDAAKFLSHLLSVLDKGLRPGDRRAQQVGERSATLLYRNDVLPPAFHAGMLSQAFATFSGRAAKVDFERKSEAMTYRISWGA